MKRNDGFTLVELLVVIIVGSLVTAAATTLLLMGMRISTRSSKLALEQNNVRLVMEVMGNLISQEATAVEPGDTWVVTGDGNSEVASYRENTIYLNGTALLEEVDSSNATWDAKKKLLTINIVMDADKSYSTSIYCRLVPDAEPEETEAVTAAELTPQEGESNIQSAYAERNFTEVLSYALMEENPFYVREFLAVLASQLGSRGQILNEAGEGTGEYFSQWYIGSYEENPGWSSETPWCACYLSWAMDQCSGFQETPRFANVDTFWAELVTEQNWSHKNPLPGDLIFFDWIVDDSYNPQHVGAVIAVTEEWIYTIEGNSGNRVTVCRYDPEDPCILGYGKLQWK